jgi:para-nitrobenzyl esterase
MGVVVETAGGRLEGVEEGGVQVFRGIPYARPPVGRLRFQAPEPAEPWSGTRSAAEFGLSACQSPMVLGILPGMEVGEQGEDCLVLNVATPRADAGRRPVLFWIHGGAFTIGSASQLIYDPTPLARRADAVVVTINYRLGAFGFLRLPEIGSSGNAGLQDQIAALRWVRENISAFGGDPENVTIFGESAGGMSVGTLLGAPQARGLFQRAIPQSGAAHAVHSLESAERVAAMLLEELGLSRGEAERLRELSPKQILEAQMRVSMRVVQSQQLLAFRPVVDGEILPEPPLEAVRRGNARGVSLLAGTCRDEWNLFGFADPAARQLDWPGLLERAELRIGEAGPAIAEAYRAARPQASPGELFFAIATDQVFRIPAIRLTEAQLGHSEQVFKYLVTFESPALGGRLGACHAVDVPFVFGTWDKPGLERFVGDGPTSRALADAMMEAWSAFARGGDPAHAGVGEWPAYDTRRRATMAFGRACELLEAPFDAERRAWEGIL